MPVVSRAGRSEGSRPGVAARAARGGLPAGDRPLAWHAGKPAATLRLRSPGGAVARRAGAGGGGARGRGAGRGGGGSRPGGGGAPWRGPAGGGTLSLAAAGCRGLAALGTPPRAAPGVAVAGDAITVEARLIAHYGAVLAAVPALAGTLRPLLAQHHDHLARLRSRLIIAPGSRASHPASPSASPPGGAPVPVSPAAALRYLRDAEDAAAAAQLAHLAAAPPSLAQLLASISASEATHALILDGHRRHR